MVSAAPSAEEVLALASEARWIRLEVSRLPREFREVIVLRELEELTYREISEVVRVPIGTVMSRLSRARDMLAERVRHRSAREHG
jgi:RNA polymerase sigma-70 factor (ECF subfamily)